MSEKKISIDLHGMRAAEAEIAIEKHIIQCINENYSQVRIVHGHGTGVLKKITQEVLSKSEFVKDFYFDPTYSTTIANLTN